MTTVLDAFGLRVLHDPSVQKLEVSDNFNSIGVFFERPRIVISTMVRCSRTAFSMDHFSRLMAMLLEFLRKGDDRFAMWVKPCSRKRLCIGGVAFDVSFTVKARGPVGATRVTGANVLRTLGSFPAYKANPSNCVISNIIVNLTNANSTEIMNEFLDSDAYRYSIFSLVADFVFRDSVTPINVKQTHWDDTASIQTFARREQK